MSNIDRLLETALLDLYEAQKKLVEWKGVYQTPLPRPRTFIFARNNTHSIVWPNINKKGDVSYDCVVVIDSYGNGYKFTLYGSSHYIINYILKLTRKSPRLTLRALRRIQSAIQWCYQRIKGMENHAQEILRQQQRAVDIINAESVIFELTK